MSVFLDFSMSLFSYHTTELKMATTVFPRCCENDWGFLLKEEAVVGESKLEMSVFLPGLSLNSS